MNELTVNSYEECEECGYDLFNDTKIFAFQASLIYEVELANFHHFLVTFEDLVLI